MYVWNWTEAAMKISAKQFRQILMSFAAAVCFFIVSKLTSGIISTISIGLFFLFCFIILLILFKALQLRKRLKRILASLRNYYSETLKKIKDFIEERQTVRITDKTDEKNILFDLDQINPLKKLKRAKRPRWKDLKNNRERIRFIYRRYIEDRLKKGAKIENSETPDEIRNILENKEVNVPAVLFSSYYIARYAGETGKIDDGTVKASMEAARHQ